MTPGQNRSLIALNKIWEWNGDWMKCRDCGRALVASRDGEALRHRPGCSNSTHNHPWSDLRHILGASRTPCVTV